MSETPKTASMPSPPWSDNSLGPGGTDTLQRANFVSMVAARLNACRLEQDSTVFGLVGPWGSGKTSVIDKIRPLLDETWKVAVFSPWASSDLQGLQVEFIAALNSAFEDGQGGQRTAAAKAAVEKYSKICTPLFKIIPVVGGGAAESIQKAIDTITAAKPWHAEFEVAANSFKDLGLKVLIIADDIDRLDSDEIVSLLKLIRLLGRFPNVHYLLAYDQTTVEALLEGRGLGTKAADFMEKIVQHPFEVPPIAAVIQRRQLNETMDLLIRTNSIKIDDQDAGRMSELIAVMGPALITPRSQIRFRQQILSFASMLSFDEIDAVDFVALSFIRVFFHKVYERLPDWRPALQSGSIPNGFMDSSELSHSDWEKLISPLVNRRDEVHLVKSILSALFPGISCPSSILFHRQHERMIANDLYFERYFILGIADDDVEDRLISAAIDGILAGQLQHDDVGAYGAIVDGANFERAALALEKGEKFRSSGNTGSAELVRYLLDRLSMRPGDDAGIASPKRTLWRWLEREVFLALQSKVITTADLQQLMSAQDLLLFVVRAMVNHRFQDGSMRAVFAGLRDYFADLLANNLMLAIASGMQIPYLVDVTWWLSGGDPDNGAVLWPVGSELVAASTPEQLERIAVAFVVEQNWIGSDGLSPELEFQEGALRRLFDIESIKKMTDMLPADSATAINTEDLSAENRQLFARVRLAAAVQRPI